MNVARTWDAKNVHMRGGPNGPRRLMRINGLPPEILCTIFEIVLLREQRDTAHPHVDPSMGTANRRHALRPSPTDLAMVCSRWRSVALGFPAMWVTVDFGLLKEPRALLYSRRARGYPLTVLSCDIFSSLIAKAVFSSKLDTVKIADIVLEGQDNLRHTTISSVFRLLLGSPSSPLILESFSLDVSSSHQPFLPAVLEVPLFGGMTPLLRHMKLAGIRLPWKRGFYRNLHTLEIRQCTSDKRSRQDVDILDVLRDCPHLHTLYLSLEERYEYGEPDDGSLLTPVPHTDHVVLPSLLHLKLAVPCRYTHHILSSIIVGSLLQLDLKLTRLNFLDGTSDTIRALPTLLPPSVLSQLDTVAVVHAEKMPILPGPSAYACILAHDSARGAARADAPRLHVSWQRSRRTHLHADFEDMLGLMASAMRLHMKPLVAQRVTLDSVSSPTPRDVAEVACAFAPYPPPTSLVGGGGAAHPAPAVYSSRATDDSDWSKLHTLVIRQCKTNDSRGVDELLQWCRAQPSLRQLYFDRVCFDVSTAAEWEGIERTLRSLPIEVRLRRCVWRCEGGPRTRTLWDEQRGTGAPGESVFDSVECARHRSEDTLDEVSFFISLDTVDARS